MPTNRPTNAWDFKRRFREAWLERLFDAYQEDGIPNIELLGDY